MWRRAHAATGLAGIVAVTVGLALPGTPPKTSDSVEKVTHTLLDNRSEFLASTYVLALGCLLLLLFILLPVVLFVLFLIITFAALR